MDVLQHLLAIIDLNDTRYEERFAAQEKAVKDALIGQEKAVNAALAASEKAIGVAEINSEKWRSNANEWRSAMDDREVRFATQAELNLQVRAIQERLDKLEIAKAGLEGRSSAFTTGWGALITAIVAGTALLTFILNYMKP